MSHSRGAVKFNSDGKIMFYEYNGTSDVCIYHLYETIKEVSDNWFNHEWLNCDCGQDEPVEIYSNYGGGFYWKGKACRFCKAFTENASPYEADEEIIDGQPEWMLDGVKYEVKVDRFTKLDSEDRISLSQVNSFGFYIGSQYFTPELLYKIAETEGFEKLVEDFEASKMEFSEESPILE